MAIIDRRTLVREVSTEDAVRELKKKIAEFERIYEVPSEQMFTSLQRNERSDTAEIAQWMVWYRALKHLSK